MEGPARFVFPVVMAGIMAFLMSAFITFINLGPSPDYFFNWAKAFLLAWPAASVAAYIAIPIARRITARVVRALFAGSSGA